MSKVSEALRKELAELASKAEDEIDFSDIPATTEEDWLKAERGRFYRPIKRRLTINLDDDIF